MSAFTELVRTAERNAHVYTGGPGTYAITLTWNTTAHVDTDTADIEATSARVEAMFLGEDWTEWAPAGEHTVTVDFLVIVEVEDASEEQAVEQALDILRDDYPNAVSPTVEVEQR